MKIKNMDNLNEAIVKGRVPQSVISDVLKRILDHILSGGSVEDPYMKQQFRYVEKVIRNIKRKEFTQQTLNKLLEEIIEEYFSDDTQRYGLGMWEVIEYVKGKYEEEIATLEIA